MSDENERKTFHEAYSRLADTIDTHLRVFFHLIHETEEAINASGDDIHTGALMLLFDFAEAIDGVSVLVRSGSARNCCQLLRTALEIGISLQYIAQDKATYTHRALAYEYYHRLDELGWAQKCDPDHERGKQLRAELKGDRYAGLFDVQAKGIDVKKAMDESQKKLDSSRYAGVRTELGNIQAEIKRARKEKQKTTATDANWYSLWGGPPNVRELASEVRP